jgi:hypothetical protein
MLLVDVDSEKIVDKNALSGTIDSKSPPQEVDLPLNSSRRKRGRPRKQERIMDTSELVPIEEAAEVFDIPVEVLRIATHRSFGVMTIQNAAQLLGIGDDALYIASDPEHPRPKFPNAVIGEVDRSGRSRKKKGSRLINILHKEFVKWVQGGDSNLRGYNPRQEKPKPEIRPCAINELVGKSTFIDEETGEEKPILLEVSSCPELVTEPTKYCSARHFVLARKARGEYKKMGESGHEGKGVRGARDRSAEATARRRQAAIKGKIANPESQEIKPTRRNFKPANAFGSAVAV